MLVLYPRSIEGKPAPVSEYLTYLRSTPKAAFKGISWLTQTGAADICAHIGDFAGGPVTATSPTRPDYNTGQGGYAFFVPTTQGSSLKSTHPY